MSEEVKKPAAWAVGKSVGESAVLTEIFKFIRLKFWRILVFALISLIFTGGVFVVLYAFMPRVDIASREILITLPKSRPVIGDTSGRVQLGSKEVFCYPNGRAFLPADLISVSVLQEVYNRHGLADKVEFEVFRGAFSVSNNTIEKAELEAVCRSRLSAKNLSAADAGRIEKEYQEKLSQLPDDYCRISMRKVGGISPEQMGQIVNDIPAVWFAQASVRYSPVLPEVPSVEFLKKLPRSSSLMRFDSAWFCLCKLKNIAEIIDKYTVNTNISVNGFDADSIRFVLENDISPRLSSFREGAVSPQGTAGDRLYLQSKLAAIEQKLVVGRAKYKVVMDALTMLNVNDAISGKSDTLAVNGDVRIDAGFLATFAEMVRKNETASMREPLVWQMLEHKKNIADLEGEKQYYASLLDSHRAVAAADAGDNDAVFWSLINDMAVVAANLRALRDEYMKNPDASRFYASLNGAMYQPLLLIPFKRLLFGLLGLWLLINVISVVRLFCKSK